MFERYTEKARRVIFFARYEASQFGASQIEAEHILLGLMREDKHLASRFFSRSQISIEAIRKDIEGRTILRERISTSVDLPLSVEAKRVLAYAAEESERLTHRHIGTEHLLLGLLREESSIAAEILYERGLRIHDIRQELNRQVGLERSVQARKETPHLFEFCRDLTDSALEGKLDPLVGREAEIDRVVQILCRRTKNNPVLIGEPGVGKTAIVEGLAQRIINQEVPTFLREKRILALDLSLVVAGTKYRGQFEERMKTIMRELADNPQYMVFIDELHTLVGAGSAEGSLDAANILKPALSRGEIQCIGATTPAEFRKSIEKDRSLERRFQSVRVPAPSEAEAVRILEGLRDRYESFHNVQYSPDAIEAAVLQSNRYLPDRFLPDKAIDVIDEAGAHVKLRAQQEPGYLPPRLRLEARERGGLDAARERGGLDAVRERGGLDAVRERGGLDAARERGGLDAARERGGLDAARERGGLDAARERGGLDAARERRDRQDNLRDRSGYDAGRDRGDYSSLTRRQAFNEALELEYQEPMPTVTKEDIDDVIARWTGIPVASLREEELVKLLRIEEELHKRVISQDSGISALARAIRRSRAGLRNPQRPVGSFLFLGPTGVGKTEVARTLAEFLFGSERSMIRFDMSEFMEKHSVSKLIGSPPGYVGHEEGGQMTERVRRNPYSVLLLDEIEKAHPDVFNILLQVLEDGLLTDSLGNTVDFRHVIIILTSNIGARFIYKRGYLGFQSSENSALAHTEDRVMSAVRDTFNPEFINRLDEIIVFEPLSDEDLLRIVNLLIGRMNQTLGQRGLEVRLTPEAAQWIVDKTCTDRSYGARPLRRALQKHVEDPLSEAIIQGHIGETPIIEVYLDADHLNYRPLLTAESDVPDELLVSQD